MSQTPALPLIDVGGEPALDDYDDAPDADDGVQDVTQDPDYEDAETDVLEADDDPEVHEVA